MLQFLFSLLFLVSISRAQTFQTLQYGIYTQRGIYTAADSSKLIIQDSTLTASGKRIIVGSLHDPQVNCVSATTRGNSYNCGGSFERFRELEKSTSLHNSRVTAAVSDSGGWHPAEFAAAITTASDSLIIWDRLTGKMFAVVVKAANNACGNNNFNDVAFRDGQYYLATAGGNCIIDFLSNQILLYSTSGVGEYQGTFQQRNAARGTLTINTLPAIVNNTGNAVATISDPFGKRDELGKLSAKWAIATGGGGSIYDAYLDGIYDSSDAQTWLGMIFGSHGSFYGTTSDATRDDLQWYYSGFSKTADAFAANDAWDNNSSGSEDLAWTSAAVIPTSKGVAAIAAASIAGNSSDILVLGSDEGLYFLHAKANDNNNGVKIRATNEGIYPPEHGDCVLAWSGWESSDGSPYNNALTNNGGPGYNTTGSSTIVFSGAYSSTSNSYLNRITETDFNLGNDAAFSISLYFKSQSATNPSTAENLLDMSDATDNDQIHIFFATDGTITARVTDDARVAYDSVDPATDYYDANWHHLELVFDGVSFIVRLDGEAAATTTQSAVNTSLDPTEVWIGASYAAGSFFNGQMTQVAINKEADPIILTRWLYSRMLASLNVEGNGRRSPSLDVDYVQCYGQTCVTGDEDSTIVWNGQLGMPLPKLRYGSPGGIIQDAAIYGPGADSIGVYQVSTTRTRFIAPDVRLSDLVQQSFAFVQPAISECVVVDSAGIIGIFWTGDDAVDAAANADKSHILFLDGTYTKFTADQTNQIIAGESWAAVIDGSTSGHAITISVDSVTIKTLQIKTTAGQGNSYDGVSFSAGADYGTVEGCLLSSSDRRGINIGSNNTYTSIFHNRLFSFDNTGIVNDGDYTRIEANQATGGEGGINMTVNGTDGVCVGNIIKDGSSTPLQLDIGANQWTVTGNRLDGIITDNATGTIAAGNNTTAF